MIALRFVIDMSTSGTGPFALVYPTVILATLYGRWEAGAVAYIISFWWAWAQVLPLNVHLNPNDLNELSRVGINAAASLVVLIFAETFRGAVTFERQRKDEEIEHGKVLLAELEHRTKNNFALVASLLELQKRRENSAHVREVLDDATRRVRTFAEAYTHLSGEQGEGSTVEMQPYLERLVARVSSAMLPPDVTVVAHFAPIDLPRDPAVAIGLFANEVLTNCAKYAFPDGRSGSIRMTLDGDHHHWVLSISDDGIGNTATPAPPSIGGIGSQLLTAFAQQARAQYSTSYEAGCTVTLEYKREAENV